MKVGYLANNLVSVPECELWMLPGLVAGVDAFRVGGVTVSRIDFGEFRLLEKSQFIDDLQDVFVYRRVPFYCVFSSLDGSEEIAAFRTTARATAVMRLTRALWLLKEGGLYNPMHFIRYRRLGPGNERYPGVYGRLAYGMQTYRLDVPELPLLEGIYYALALFDEARYAPAVDLAERLFIQTYSPALLDARDFILILLGSFEALAGTAGNHLRNAAWLTAEQRDLVERFRQTRNGIAHGQQSASREEALALRELIRILLREAILWTLEDARRRTVVGKALVKRVLEAGDPGPGRLAAAQTHYTELPMRGLTDLPF